MPAVLVGACKRLTYGRKTAEHFKFRNCAEQFWLGSLIFIDAICCRAIDAKTVLTVKTSEWERLGFQAALERLQTTGAARADSIAPGRLYANSPEPDGMFCLVRRSAAA